MDNNDGWITRLGPILRALGFAVGAFVMVWAITPYLTAARSTTPTPAASTVTAPTIDGLGGTGGTPTTTSTTMLTPITRVAVGDAGHGDMLTWDDRNSALVDDPGWPASLEPTGSLNLSAYPTNETKDGVLTDRDLVEWTIEVQNVSGEKVWGVFVYQEFAGRADCDDRILDDGEATTCTVWATAYWGAQTADVWTTAWPLDDRMMADRLLQPYLVAPRP